MQIEQIDRDAAAELLGGAAPDGLREGMRDSLSLVQAFAAHRIAAHPPVTDADVERVALKDPIAVHLNMLRGGIAIPSLANLIHASPEVAALDRENKNLREALQPFLDLKAQKGAHGVISKALDGMAPMTVTVTKSQMLAAIAAYRGE